MYSKREVPTALAYHDLKKLVLHWDWQANGDLLGDYEEKDRQAAAVAWAQDSFTVVAVDPNGCMVFDLNTGAFSLVIWTAGGWGCENCFTVYSEAEPMGTRLSVNMLCQYDEAEKGI